MSSLLTPNNPDPLTGLANPIVGWCASPETINDVFEGCNIVYAANWTWVIEPDLESITVPPNWQITFHNDTLSATKDRMTVVVNNTDWFSFDGLMVRVLTADQVASDWTVEEHTLPATASTTMPSRSLPAQAVVS